jgi:glutamine cyclotransferase
MKPLSLAVSTAALLISNTYGYVDLMPAYSVRMSGSDDWELIRKYDVPCPIFIEGLEMIDDNRLIQSVGEYSGSKLQQISLDHANLKIKTDHEVNLPQFYFGEGCTRFNGKIYQMTYREGKVFVYNAETLE